MSRFYYSLARSIGRFIGFQTMQIRVLHADRAELTGGFVLASSHLSHLDPCVLSGLMRRKVDWMARIEFYRHRVVALLLQRMDALPVNRQGVPVKAIRSAIRRTRHGRVIGIFPEGGVVSGEESAMLGGPIRLGACLIAQRANVPVVPAVVLGSHHMTRVLPWLPWRRIKLRVAFGEPIYPLQSTSRRKARMEIGERLAQAYRALHAELCQEFEIPRETGTRWPDA